MLKRVAQRHRVHPLIAIHKRILMFNPWEVDCIVALMAGKIVQNAFAVWRPAHPPCF